MIIEDDEILNAGLCYNLQKRKIEPFSAGSIKEARRSLVGNTYDLILLDVNLPDGSGFEFAREIAARYDTPFIFLTAHNLDDEVIGGYRRGGGLYHKAFQYKNRDGKNTGSTAQMRGRQGKRPV